MFSDCRMGSVAMEDVKCLAIQVALGFVRHAGAPHEQAVPAEDNTLECVLFL